MHHQVKSERLLQKKSVGGTDTSDILGILRDNMERRLLLLLVLLTCICFSLQAAISRKRRHADEKFTELISKVQGDWRIHAYINSVLKNNNVESENKSTKKDGSEKKYGGKDFKGWTVSRPR